MTVTMTPAALILDVPSHSRACDLVRASPDVVESEEEYPGQ
jgi:hypothetical protein